MDLIMSYSVPAALSAVMPESAAVIRAVRGLRLIMCRSGWCCHPESGLVSEVAVRNWPQMD